MHILLRWGGGGCHGDMSTKPMSRSKVGTFDKAVIGCPVTGSRGRGHGTPRVHWAVTSHCDVTPSRGDTW